MTININISAVKKPIHDRSFVFVAGNYCKYALAILTFIASGAFANDDLTQVLDMQSAVAKSLRQHPELASVEFRLRSADAYAQQAAVGEKPELNLSVEDTFGSGEFSGLDSAQSTLSISWILEGPLLDRRVESMQSKKDVIQMEKEIKRYDIAAATAHDFLNALAFQERLEIAKKAGENAGHALGDVRKRTQSGKSPAADLLRAEVNLERRQLEIDDITHELDVAKRLLAAQWGETQVNFSELLGSLVIKNTVIDFSSLQKSIIGSPKVRYFLTQERVAQTEIALAKEQARNRFRLSSGVRRFDRSDDYAVVFGVAVPFGGPKRNQARITALSEQKASYQADARAEEIKLSAKIYSLYEKFKHNVHQSEALQKQIIPRLEKALVETRKAYEVGKYSYREWSAVQQEVLAARVELTNSRLSAHSSAIELERLTGQSPSTITSTDTEQH